MLKQLVTERWYFTNKCRVLQFNNNHIVFIVTKIFVLQEAELIRNNQRGNDHDYGNDELKSYQYLAKHSLVFTALNAAFQNRNRLKGREVK